MANKKEDLGWIQTFTGRKFDLIYPEVEDVVIEDIAHALSMKCRYNGHCKEFYSVAEHSVRVSLMLELEKQTPEVQFFGLMHDAAEAYLPDVPSPLKHLPEFGFFRDVERGLETTIAAKFDLPIFKHPVVDWADKQIVFGEMARLMSPLHPDCFHQGGIPIEGRMLGPERAENFFLFRYNELLKLK